MARVEPSWIGLVPYKEALRALSASCHTELREKMAVCNPEQGPCQNPPSWPLISDFQPPKL